METQSNGIWAKDAITVLQNQTIPCTDVISEITSKPGYTMKIITITYQGETSTIKTEAIANMFEQDHSAARGEMNVRGLYIWKHASLYGNAHAHRIFDTLKVEKKAGVVEPTAFTDYQVIVDETALPESVTLRTYDI